MREFNAYVKEAGRDPVLIAATIKAIGRVAAWMPSLTDSCLRGLMQLIQTAKQEDMVAESVVVVRTLVQQAPETRVKMIRQLARMLEKIRAPMARASIVWMLGSYHELVPKLAPDALRELVKSFKTEESQVKLQVLNLGSKLFLAQPENCESLFRYLLDMARYDMDFDIRDRARLIRGILLSGDSSMVEGKASRLLTGSRMAPEFVAPSHGRTAFVLNTLSHVVSHQVSGYIPIGDHPDEVPDASIREPIMSSEVKGSSESKKSKKDDKTLQTI